MGELIPKLGATDLEHSLTSSPVMCLRDNQNELIGGSKNMQGVIWMEQLSQF